jgi:peroxiredoxin
MSGPRAVGLQLKWKVEELRHLECAAMTLSSFLPSVFAAFLATIRQSGMQWRRRQRELQDLARVFLICTTLASCSNNAREVSPPTSGSGMPATQQDAGQAGQNNAGDVVKSQSGESRLEVSTSDLVDRYDDAVVFITVSDALGNDVSVGTGCIIQKSGLIATNRHVIAEAVSARVELRDGKKLPVRGVMASDESHDLAILQVDNLPDSVEQFELQPLPSLRPGDAMIAIGHPMEFQFTVSDGILSAIRKTDQLPAIHRKSLGSNTDTEWLQTTAAISNGSSGGPLLTRKGQLVGLNTWIASGQNLGFAVSVTHLIELSRTVGASPVAFPLPDASVIAGPDAAILWKDFRKSLVDYLQRLQSADTLEAQKKLWQRENPISMSLARCRERMDRATRVSDQVDTMLVAHQIRGVTLFVSGIDENKRHFSKIYEMATASLAREAEIQRVLPLIATGPYGSEMDVFLRRVFDEHPVKKARAAAGLALAGAMQMDEHSSRHLPEAIELLQRVQSLYGDEIVNGESVNRNVGEQLARLRILGAGGQIQQIVGRNEEGQTVRLSDHRGKVVVLDFWADWSPRCRASYEQKRQLISSLKDQPFLFLGVNCDETPRLSARLKESGQVTWESLFDGSQGVLAQGWFVQDLPTTFIIAPDGIVRQTITDDQPLEDAVRAALEESVVQLPGDLLPREAEWRWYCGRQPPPEGWQLPEFAGDKWSKGKAPLGYGRGRPNTNLDYGDIDQKWMTVYFRAEFEVPDPSACPALILQMTADDGAAVCLNGNEVLRQNLPNASDSSTSAILSNDSEIVAQLNKSQLVPGRNVLAVEVHQNDARSGDLLLDLSLSSRLPDLPAIRDAKSDQTKIRFCQLASAVNGEDHEANESEIDELLKSLSEDKNFAVRVSGLIARACRSSRPEEIAVPEDFAINEKELLTILYGLNATVWETVRVSGFSESDYQRIVPLARAISRLAEKTQGAGSIANTCGVALYRAGHYELALGFLDRSTLLEGENTVDLAYRAMTLHALGRSDEAKNALARARKFRDRPDWPANDEAILAVEQADQILSNPSQAVEE